MKRLKVKTINAEFLLGAGPSYGDHKIKEFEAEVNEFLNTLEPEDIYAVSYLNSSSAPGDDQKHRSILIALITHFED